MSIVLSTEPMRRRSIVPGILVSLALHAALIFGYRLAAPEPPPELSPNRTMTVWLLPTPVTAPAPAASAIPAQPEAAPRLAAQAPATRERRDAREPGERSRSRPQPHDTTVHDRTPAAITAVAPPVPAPADTTVVADTAKPAGADYDPLRAPAEPKPFDIEAARKAARKVAVEKPAPGTLAAQLQTHPLYPEDDRNKLEKDMARAGRPDCLKGGGNLLTPLFWLLDKKDHGCKL